MELIALGESTYVIKNNTNIGVFKVNATDVYLIDTGNDASAGKKILKFISENNWRVMGIINTHSHADHIGGNKIIQERTGCKIYASNSEIPFIEHPILEATTLYGGTPFSKLKNKFLYANPSQVQNCQELQDFEILSLKGHSFDMIGIKTKDDVYFLGDALFSLETIQKYHLFYIQDVKDFLHTLEILENLKGKFFIPSHTEILKDIKELISYNRDKVFEIIDAILEFLNLPQTFESLLEHMFHLYHLTMNENQYVLIGSTIRNYMTYLYEEEKISYEFIENKMYWRNINGKTNVS